MAERVADPGRTAAVRATGMLDSQTEAAFDRPDEFRDTLTARRTAKVDLAALTGGEAVALATGVVELNLVWLRQLAVAKADGRRIL